MSKEMETLEAIEESKEALVEASEENESSVVKTLIGVGLVGLTIAAAGFGVYHYIKKKKADDVFEDEFPEEPVEEPEVEEKKDSKKK